MIESNSFVQKIGPFLGFGIAMTALIGGIELVMKGKDASGLAAIITALASPLGVFIYGKMSQRRNLDEKAQDLAKPRQLAKR